MDRFFKAKKQNFFKMFVFCLSLLLLTFICAAPETVYASESSGLGIEANLGDLDISVSTDDSNNGLASTLQILILLTVISLAPSILIMVTSFTRILIVLHFVRSAMGVQTTPPNQVLIGLALFLTLFIMSPVMTEVNEQAIKPLAANEITTEEAIDLGLEPIRNFMFGQIRNETDLTMFCDIAGIEEVSSLDDIPTYVLIPAFIISELRIAFYIGFIIYISLQKNVCHTYFTIYFSKCQHKKKYKTNACYP